MKKNVRMTLDGQSIALPHGLCLPLLLLAFLCLGTANVSAQTEHRCGKDLETAGTRYSIAYGQSLNVEAVNPEGLKATWKVSPADGVSKTSGEGNATGELSFSKPGHYEVTFSVPAHDDHGPQTAKAIVEVASESMTFDTKSVAFSKPLVKGQPADGTVLTVDVEVSFHKKHPFTYGPVTLSSTGITGITATLAETVKLKKGTNRVSFVLSGTPQHAGPAQLGFYNALGEGFYHNFKIAEQ